MKKGILIYDSSTNRFDVLYEEGNSYGGLHCGTAICWQSFAALPIVCFQYLS